MIVLHYQSDITRHNPILAAMTIPAFRFAPSPNGELHLGHAYSALLNANLAESRGGQMLLRIEDIDATRCTPQFEQAIYRDLEWLGFEWNRPVRRQSEHFELYADALARLRRDGLVYPAFMSRGELRAFITEYEAGGKSWPRDPDGVPLYPQRDRQATIRAQQECIASGQPFSWRLNMQSAIEATGQSTQWMEFALSDGDSGQAYAAAPEAWGDVVIARSDIPTSYHLAVVLDDALQSITHVVRGRDLFDATSVQLILQRLLGLPQPLYHHHRLILGADGRKLSKSEGSTGLRALREAGKTPDDIRALIGL